MFSWGLFLILVGICILLFWKNKNRLMLWLREQRTNINNKLIKKRRGDFTINEYIIHNITDRMNDWNPNIQIIPTVMALIGVLITLSVGFMVLTQVKEAVSTSTVNSTELAFINETESFFFLLIPLALIGAIGMGAYTVIRMFK